MSPAARQQGFRAFQKKNKNRKKQLWQVLLSGRKISTTSPSLSLCLALHTGQTSWPKGNTEKPIAGCVLHAAEQEALATLATRKRRASSRA